MVSPVIDAKNWTKTMEILEDCLKVNIGVKGVPLSYVVISKEALDPNLDEHDTSFFHPKMRLLRTHQFLKVV